MVKKNMSTYKKEDEILIPKNAELIFGLSISKWSNDITIPL